MLMKIGHDGNEIDDISTVPAKSDILSLLASVYTFTALFLILKEISKAL